MSFTFKTRDVVVAACLGGVCVGFGAFSIFHYLMTEKKYQKQLENANNNRLFGGPVRSTPLAISRLTRHYSNINPLEDDIDDTKELDIEDQVKALREKNYQLQNLLTIAESQKYDITSPNQLSASDIETIRSIFDFFDSDQDGCVSNEELINIYSKLGEALTDNEAKEIINECEHTNENKIAFNTLLTVWHQQHKGGKRNKSYAKKFKFMYANIVDNKNFDPSKLVIKPVGRRNTTEFRFTFHYIQRNNKLKKISPWHDIPLYTTQSTKQMHLNIFNFICEIPKWSRAKYEIATGETYNPIHQDVRNGKLRFYQHGDMMFNYGAFPQTWENPKHIPKDTECPGDNDPLDVIEFGTKQLATGSVTPVKVLGVLSLLDSGETDWKILAIAINDPLANIMNDVHDFENHMPGAIHAIREYLRIYKVCTGQAENKFAFGGEALNSEYGIEIINQTHEEWRKLHEQKTETV